MTVKITEDLLTLSACEDRKVWWLMLAKDKERQTWKEQTERQTEAGGNRQRQTGKEQTERCGKGVTDGGSQRTSCFVAKMDHFTSFRIICMRLLDFAALKSYDISMQITCVWDFETSRSEFSWLLSMYLLPKNLPHFGLFCLKPVFTGTTRLNLLLSTHLPSYQWSTLPPHCPIPWHQHPFQQPPSSRLLLITSESPAFLYSTLLPIFPTSEPFSMAPFVPLCHASLKPRMAESVY